MIGRGRRCRACCWPWRGWAPTPGSRLRRCWTRPTASSPTWGIAWGRAVVAFVAWRSSSSAGPRPPRGQAAAQAVGLFRALEDGWGLSGVLYHYGYGVQRFGAYADAVPMLEEAIEVAAAAGVHNTVQWATADLGLALAGARPGRRGLGLLRPRRNRLRPGRGSRRPGPRRLRRSSARGQDGDYARAGPLFESARAGFERLGVWLATGLALAGLADCYLRTGDLDAARERFERTAATRRHHR